MYGFESWTIKKAEHWRIDAFELWCWKRFLIVPWTAWISNQSILKKINTEYSLGGLMQKLKLRYFGHLMQRANSLEILWPPDAGKDWGQEEKGGATEVGRYHWCNGQEFERTLRDTERQGSLACCSPWGHKELDMTKWLNNNKMWKAVVSGPGLHSSRSGHCQQSFRNPVCSSTVLCQTW